jgi:hypothetical protein
MKILIPLNLLIAAGTIISQAAAAPGLNQNLVANGDFENPEDPLKYWKYDYSDTGNSWYANNKKYVSVLDTYKGARGVLRFQGTSLTLSDPGQGIKVDSKPIRVNLDNRYKLTARACSTGAGSRILVEGYHWRPGIMPHPNPKLSELRKCYKFKLIYFKDQSGGIAEVPQNWETASLTFPKKDLSKLARKYMKKIEFFVIHVMAVGGSPGTSGDGKYQCLYIDEIRLEEVR